MRIPSKAEPGQVCRPAPTWFYAFVPHKLGSGLTSTLLPLFVVQVVGGNVTDVGWVTSLAALVAVPASIWWGNLSDRLRRRRPFIILGFLGFTVSLLLIALGRSVPQVLAVSTFGALLTTAIEPAASALVLDQTTEDQWPECLGRLNQVSGWSFVAGLMVGMIWMTLLPRYWGTVTAMRALFLVAGGITSLSLIFTSVWLPGKGRA